MRTWSCCFFFKHGTRVSQSLGFPGFHIRPIRGIGNSTSFWDTPYIYITLRFYFRYLFFNLCRVVPYICPGLSQFIGQKYLRLFGIQAAWDSSSWHSIKSLQRRRMYLDYPPGNGYISHLGKRNIIFKMPFLGDMLVPWRVSIYLQIHFSWLIPYQFAHLCISNSRAHALHVQFAYQFLHMSLCEIIQKL